MKILNAEKIRALDEYTIKNEPIESIDLMERASRQFVKWFKELFPDDEARPVYVFCGTGNNGGDGLAVSRMLFQQFYEVEIFICKFSNNFSEDCQINYDRAKKSRGLEINEIKKGDEFPEIPDNAIVIDAVFGSGLNRPVTGYWADLFAYLNGLNIDIASIDIPSGLFADKTTSSTSIFAGYTLSFEVPKFAFLFPQNYERVGEWYVTSIGLDKGFLKTAETDNFFITKDMVKSFLKSRKKYEHKGNFGHALLIAGSYGKIGAAVLAAKGCLRSGTGLVTVHVPKSGYKIIQISFPEAMVSIDKHKKVFSKHNDVSGYDAIGIGCGLGTHELTDKALEQLFDDVKFPVVIDADALNIIGKNRNLLKKIPANSILTPHPKEFERLFGKTKDDFERNDLQRKKAVELGIYIVLKGANTCIATPEGKCYFNSTGNPGMATAGSGDVLTGILTGIFAQGYSPLETCILGVFLHGLAGDIAAGKSEYESLIAGDIIDHLGAAYSDIRKSH